MPRCPGRAAVAALRSGFAAPAFASRAAPHRGNPLPGRSELALTPAVPSQLLRFLSLGGRARPGGAARVGADALLSTAVGLGAGPTAVGLGAGGCRGGVSRGFAGSRGGSTGGGGNWSKGPDGRQGGGGHGGAPSRKIHPGKLTNLIKQCSDVGGLQGLVVEHGGSFNHIHVSAAWVTLRKMRRLGGGGSEEVLVQQPQDLARQTVHSMGARGIVNIVHAMGKMAESRRIVVDYELAGELLGRAKATVGDFEPQGVANLVWAMAKMGITNPEA
ncbi:hypothetical protein T484DRAFT_1801270, partial [Baffinella frigidus]